MMTRLAILSFIVVRLFRDYSIFYFVVRVLQLTKIKKKRAIPRSLNWNYAAFEVVESLSDTNLGLHWGNTVPRGIICRDVTDS